MASPINKRKHSITGRFIQHQLTAQAEAEGLL